MHATTAATLQQATVKATCGLASHKYIYQQFFSIAPAHAYCVVTHVGDLRVAFSRSASTSAMDSGSGFPSVSGTIAIEAAPQQHDTANSQYGIEGQEGATVKAAGARTPPRPSICTNHSASVRGRPHYSNRGMTRDHLGYNAETKVSHGRREQLGRVDVPTTVCDRDDTIAHQGCGCNTRLGYCQHRTSVKQEYAPVAKCVLSS